MNINLETFLLQCAALGVWVFLVAGIYAIVEKLLDKHFPGLLDVAPGSDPMATPATGTDVPKQV
jgi:hypothetical protein